MKVEAAVLGYTSLIVIKNMVSQCGREATFQGEEVDWLTVPPVFFSSFFSL